MVRIFSDEVVTKLAAKLQGWKSDEELSKLYLQWPSNDQLMMLKKEVGIKSEWVDELIDSELRPFNKTLILRNKIMGVEFTLPLSKWIIEIWGGIPPGKNNDDTSLKKCIELAEKSANNAKLNFHFDRIASWSKHIAFKYPRKYAIYDSRVIYSLNWLLFEGKEKSKKYFPIPSGRNPIMELLDYSCLPFIAHYIERVDEVISRLKEGGEPRIAHNLRSELFIKRGQAFSEYCELLKMISHKLYPDDKSGLALAKVEMILFSLADKEIPEKVLRDVSKIMSQSDEDNSIV